MSLSRRWKISIVGVTILGICTVFVSGAVSSPAFAKAPPAPTVSKLTATPSKVTKAGELVMISAKVANADKCIFYASHINSFPGNELSCTTGTVFDIFAIPENKSSKPRIYKFTLGLIGYDSKTVTSEPVNVTVGAGDGGTVPLGGVASEAVASEAGNGSSSCVVLASSDVGCWGTGDSGELGDGFFINSDAPVEVTGVGGSGILSGVTQLAGSQLYGGFCALLSSSSVDCWGAGYDGELGDGLFVNSSTPLEVEGVNGVGVLTGVTNILSDGDGFCALLSSRSVDCWGAGASGQLGDGATTNSATPVEVEGVSGSGTLTGVTELSTVADGSDETGYCTLLTSTGVDCWGTGMTGQLGNGSFGSSTVPVEVEGVNGSGTLTGVTQLSSFGGGGYGDYCALLTTGGVNCWGDGSAGQLGNGTFYNNSPYGSATPVAVVGLSGSGALTGVTSILGGSEGNYCALLSSSGVDCWGSGSFGELGNGTFYSSSPYGSAIPVAVVGLGGSGTLTGVTNLSSDGIGNCALLTSGGVDCWGYGPTGQLGNGTFYSASPSGSASPVAVEGTTGAGTLADVANVVGMGNASGYCALLTSSDLDCWGGGSSGQLGDGAFYQSSNGGIATPVSVIKATDLNK